MGGPEFARQLLASAGHDRAAWQLLARDPAMHDSMLGFHAQQMIEKCLKAVLAHRGVAFRRTHDLSELLDLMADQLALQPPHADRLDELNPYAVEARYGWPFDSRLDRAQTETWLDAVMAWAVAQVGG